MVVVWRIPSRTELWRRIPGQGVNPAVPLRIAVIRNVFILDFEISLPHFDIGCLGLNLRMHNSNLTVIGVEVRMYGFDLRAYSRDYPLLIVQIHLFGFDMRTKISNCLIFGVQVGLPGLVLFVEMRAITLITI